MKKVKEIQTKIESIRELMKQHSKTSLLITEQPNFSWLTCGSRGFLGLASTKACASLLVTQDNVYLLSNNIEGRRLMQEEGLEAFCELRDVPWQQGDKLPALISELAGEQPVDDAAFSKELAALRQKLTEDELCRYSALCRDAADAVEGTMSQFESGISEFEAAGKIASALWSKGIEPISLFVAADDRVGSWRHFIPTAKKAWKQMIISICGRRNGLVTSITRTVAFGEISTELKEHYEKLMKVQLESWKALQMGKKMSEIYQKICSAYVQNGLDEEWMNHHQGGLTGYMPREIIVNDRTDKLIAEGQAYAFNPSCRFAKVEDTVSLTSDGVKLLSTPGENWPGNQIDGYCCPGIYVIRK